jgi:hypothetical protein
MNFFRLCKKYFTKGIDVMKNIFTMNTSTNETQRGNKMTNQQLAALEAKAEAAWRKEQAAQMAVAMKAVNEVSKQHNRTSMTYGVVRK